jgi:hypothetical protein
VHTNNLISTKLLALQSHLGEKKKKSGVKGKANASVSWMIFRLSVWIVMWLDVAVRFLWLWFFQ